MAQFVRKIAQPNGVIKVSDGASHVTLVTSNARPPVTVPEPHRRRRRPGLNPDAGLRRDLFQVDQMLRTLSDITGWKVERTVPAEILSKDDFRKMVEEGVQDAETDKETHAAEIALKMFGLVPQDFNLAPRIRRPARRASRRLLRLQEKTPLRAGFHQGR